MGTGWGADYFVELVPPGAGAWGHSALNLTMSGWEDEFSVGTVRDVPAGPYEVVAGSYPSGPGSNPPVTFHIEVLATHFGA